jgi:hypothetical protein
LLLRTPRWTDRPAINLGRLHPDKEDAIESTVSSSKRFVVLERIHDKTSMDRLLATVSPFSAMGMAGVAAGTLCRVTDRTYGTNRTNRSCRISPMSPIGPILLRARVYRLETRAYFADTSPTPGVPPA